MASQPSAFQRAATLSDDLTSWDTWLCSQGGRGGFGQTATWARILRAADGVEHRVVRAGDAAALLLLRPPEARGLRGRLRGARPTVECLDGPILSDVGQLPAVLDALLVAARTEKAGAITVTPPPRAGWGDTKRAREIFAAAGYVHRPWLTLLVNLADGEEGLVARLHRSARKAVRRAERAGIVIERLTDRMVLVDRFFRPYAAFSQTDVEALVARGLATVRSDDRHAYAWFVAIDPTGDVVGTLGTCRHGGVATEIMSSRSPSTDLPVQDLLHWEVMRHHRALGDEVFDLAGISPTPLTDAEAGIRRFKEKWGGAPTPVPRYDLRL